MIDFSVLDKAIELLKNRLIQVAGQRDTLIHAVLDVIKNDPELYTAALVYLNATANPV